MQKRGEQTKKKKVDMIGKREQDKEDEVEVEDEMGEVELVVNKIKK